MKTNKIFSLVSLSAVCVAWQSCTSESPFSSDGEGSVSFKTEMYSDVAFDTRALDDQTKASLEQDLIIYIENSKGVIKKYEGKSSIPESLTLQAGNYAIEGWTGDSLSASYDRKFYRGYQQFTVQPGINNTVTFNVNIANVIASVDLSQVSQELKDLKVTFNHTRASLDFDNEKIAAGLKGYFMMPTGDNDLYYKVELSDANGDPVVKDGVIKNVQRAHEYSLQLALEQPENDKGGTLVKINVLDIPVLDYQMDIYTIPTFKATYGQNVIDLSENQIDCTEDKYDLNLRIVGYGGLSNVSLSFKDGFGNEYASVNGINLKNYGTEKDNAVSVLNSHGITIEEKENIIEDYQQEVNEHVFTFSFSGSDFFGKLDENQTAYIIDVNATDGRGYTNNLTISIANTEDAIIKNMVGSVEAPDTYGGEDPFAILTTTAELQGMVYSDEAQNYGIEYRVKDSGNEFTQVKANATKADGTTFTVKLTGLNPGTTYEYRAFCDGFSETKTRTFTTEGKYVIPNYDMSLWSKNSKGAYIPNDVAEAIFWDTGNHGSMSVSGLGKNISMPDDNFIPGNRVAKLQSTAIAGVFAAGNLFVGKFGSTVGMSGAKLDFGREYNGSHPSALKIKVNYRPGKVDKIKARDETADLKSGENDYGQVYVALANGASSLNTADDNMFNPKAENILAYGQISWNENIGEENQLETITIPLKYYNKSKNIKPTHLIIVCSASKFGDYFSGSTSSVLYLDDFELEYGDIQFE